MKRPTPRRRPTVKHEILVRDPSDGSSAWIEVDEATAREAPVQLLDPDGAGFVFRHGEAAPG